MIFCGLFKRPSVIFYGALLMLVFSKQSFAAVNWDTPPEDITATWDGLAGITDFSSNGRIDAVKKGGARNFRVKGRGNPAPGKSNPFELSAVGVVDPLIITTTTFTRSSGGESATLLHNQRSSIFTGGDDVAVEVQIDISQASLLAAEAGFYTGSIDLCIGKVNGGCNTGNNNTDEATQSIEITIPKRVAVRGLGDIGALSYIPGSPATGVTNFCIGTNSPDGVKVTFSSDASSGYGLVGDNSGEDLAYTLTFTAGASDVTPAVDTATAAFTDGVDDLTCGTETTSMQLEISVADGDITSAGDTDFTENLVLLIEPE